jgi:hypothetical protein
MSHSRPDCLRQPSVPPAGRRGSRFSAMRGIGLDPRGLLVRGLFAPIGLALSLTGIGSAAEPDTPSTKPADVRERIEEAEELAEEGRTSRAVKAFAVAAEAYAGLLAQPRPPSGTRVLRDRLNRLKASLTLEGVDPAELEIPSGSPSPPAGRGDAMPPAGPMAGQPGFARPSPAGMGVPSFVNDVAPTLVRRCGGCHVQGRRGDFQMAGYAGLMQSGVVQRGSGQSSRLVEVILTGDMPRGGGKVEPHEMATLVRWIDAGAPFDGTDPRAALDAPAAPAGPNASTAARPKIAEGAVSFAFDVAPVLLEQCMGCHSGRNPRARLQMQSFATLSRGGESGSPFTAGRGGESLLVRKLQGVGIEGQRMPLGRPALPTDVIATIRRWIDEGAVLDLGSPGDPLDVVAALGRAERLPHDKLRDLRFAAAEKVFLRGVPDEQPVKEVRGDLCVIGNLPEPAMQEIADRAEKAYEAVAEEYAGPLAGGPLVKGGCVLFICRKSYDYSGFWLNLLDAERPKPFSAHASSVDDVVYGVILADDAASSDLDLLLEEQIAASAWLSRGAPAWFAIGAARTTASRLQPKAPLAREWGSTWGGVRAAPPAAADLFSGEVDRVAAAVHAQRFLSAASGGGARLAAILGGLGANTPFDQAFTEALGGAPEALYAQWRTRAGGSRGR